MPKVPSVEQLLTPGLRLAVQCCARSFAPERASLFCVDVDWSDFLDLVRFHRIEGLAWNALSSTDALPDDVRAEISQAASMIAAQNLLCLRESRALLSRLEKERIPVIFLKGLTLGSLAYGNSAIKSAIDLDLLIDPADLSKAAAILRQSGYGIVAPRSDADGRIRSWHRPWKESVWTRASPRSQIDLHTRVADNFRLIPSIDVHSQRQIVPVADGIALPTFALDELFAYLAVHGASSAWFRLKWISDFAGLVHRHGSDEIDRLYRRSQELGAGRAAGQALLVADSLFGTLEAQQWLRTKLAGDTAVSRLARSSLRMLTRRPVEPTADKFGTWPIRRMQFQLLPGVRYKLSELSGQARRFLTRP